MQEDLSTERMAKLSSEMHLRQLQLDHQKQAADLEDLRKRISTMDAKLNKSGSIGNSLSLHSIKSSLFLADDVSVSEQTDRDGETTSTRSYITSKQHQVERLQKQVQSLEKTRGQ